MGGLQVKVEVQTKMVTLNLDDSSRRIACVCDALFSCKSDKLVKLIMPIGIRVLIGINILQTFSYLCKDYSL